MSTGASLDVSCSVSLAVIRNDVSGMVRLGVSFQVNSGCVPASISTKALFQPPRVYHVLPVDFADRVVICLPEYQTISVEAFRVCSGLVKSRFSKNASMEPRLAVHPGGIHNRGD